MSFKIIIQSAAADPRALFLALALMLYALFSSPTPNNPHLMEGLIAALLLITIGGYAFVKIFQFRGMERWQVAGQLLFIYGVIAPLILAGFYGHDVGLILRDLAGFFFLCLPLFLYPFLRDKPARQKLFLNLLLFIGLIFSVRVLTADVIPLWEGDKLLYLANSPLVLLTALYCLSVGLRAIIQRLCLKNIIIFCLSAFVIIVIILAMMEDLQRASLIVIALSTAFILLITLIQAPKKVSLSLFILVPLAFIAAPYLVEVIEDINTKTALVGVNMRTQEFKAVWQILASSPHLLIMGQGWGSFFASPAVGDLNVTFTHSLLSYMFLKTGLIGLGLSLIYLFFIFEKIANLYLTDSIKGNYLLWPFIIPVLLYASYKSMDFGLVLTLILLAHPTRETA